MTTVDEISGAVKRFSKKVPSPATFACRSVAVLLLLALVVPPESAADTVCTSFPKECRRDVIVVEEEKRTASDGDEIHSVRYYYILDGIVDSAGPFASRRRGESLLIERSSRAERQEIVARWKAAGWTVETTDLAGKTTTLFNAGVDFLPPKGMMFTPLGCIGCRPSPAINIRVGANEQAFSFKDIHAILFNRDNEDMIRLQTVRGDEVSGRVVPRTAQFKDQKVALDAVITGTHYFDDRPVEKSIESVTMRFTQLKSLVIKVTPR